MKYTIWKLNDKNVPSKYNETESSKFHLEVVECLIEEGEKFCTRCEK